jgi:hypothetical protein
MQFYRSLVTGTEARAPTVANSLASLSWKVAVNSLTICGHSLGAALATLLAFDVGANTRFKNPTVYTYAGPRTGDQQFANAYNRCVPNTFRIANRMDLVPNLPVPPLYEHVLGEFGLNPVVLASRLNPW